MSNTPDFTRREFIKKSAAGGVTLLAPGVVLLGAHAQDQAGATTGADRPASRSKALAILENEMLRIELNSESGDIAGLYNKRTGKEYIVARQWARAFRLNVPLPNRVTGFNADYSANSFDSWEQTKCDITKESTAGSQTVRVHYPALESKAGKFPIELSYSIRLPNGSDQAILQLELVNHTPYQVKEVFFPWISGVGSIEGGQADTFVAPNIVLPAADLRKNYYENGNWEEYPYLLGNPGWPSPGHLSMPWMNYGGKEEGLYLASLSHDGIRHMLMIQDFGAAGHPIFGFAWAFPSYSAPGKPWCSPEIVLSLHTGDWHAAADTYRASLDDWYQKPDTQQEFKRVIGSFNSFFTQRDFMQIADLAEDIRKYGLQHLVMWNFGDYYPAVLEEDDLSVDPPRLGQFTPQWGGLARLKAANKKARDLGVNTGIIFSSRLWNKDTLTPMLCTMAEKWVLRRESGDPIVESWDHQHLGARQWSNWEQSYGHLDYCMCNAVEGWRSFTTRNILGVLSQAGYSTMFYDEAIETSLCFSSEHNHSNVSAPSMGTYSFVKSLKAAMLANNPEATLMGEGWEVVASQILDAGWTWAVPSNPEVFRYTLPWVIAAAAVRVDAAEVNRYLVLGLHMAIVAKGLENGKNLSDFPEFAQHLARLVKFRETTERFLVDGTYQDDVGLRVSGAFAKVYQTRHEVAIIMANLTETATDAGFELEMRPYGIAAASYSAISSSGVSGNETATVAGARLKGRASLAPYEVIAAVFKRQD